MTDVIISQAMGIEFNPKSPIYFDSVNFPALTPIQKCPTPPTIAIEKDTRVEDFLATNPNSSQIWDFMSTNDLTFDQRRCLEDEYDYLEQWENSRDISQSKTFDSKLMDKIYAIVRNIPDEIRFKMTMLEVDIRNGFYLVKRELNAQLIDESFIPIEIAVDMIDDLVMSAVPRFKKNRFIRIRTTIQDLAGEWYALENPFYTAGVPPSGTFRKTQPTKTQAIPQIPEDLPLPEVQFHPKAFIFDSPIVDDYWEYDFEAPAPLWTI